MACEDGSLLQVTLKRGSKETEDFTAEECITPGGVSGSPLDRLIWHLAFQKSWISKCCRSLDSVRWGPLSLNWPLVHDGER